MYSQYSIVPDTIVSTSHARRLGVALRRDLSCSSSSTSTCRTTLKPQDAPRSPRSGPASHKTHVIVSHDSIARHQLLPAPACSLLCHAQPSGTSADISPIIPDRRIEPATMICHVLHLISHCLMCYAQQRLAAGPLACAQADAGRQRRAARARPRRQWSWSRARRAQPPSTRQDGRCAQPRHPYHA